jgi:tetratricopeptide (TPR) repeat protein
VVAQAEGSAGDDQDVPAATSKQDEARQAQEERIQEYLRKREERRAQKERARLEREAAAAGAAVGAGAVESTRTDEVVVDAESGKKRKKKKKNADSEYVLPKELAMAQETVRRSHLGENSTVVGYLDLIDAFEASPHQLAAFGSFLAEHGLLQEAIVYYDVALGIESDDPLLWANLGTLFRQAGQYNDAISAYVEALSLDSNSAMAHYNLGSVLDAKGKYDSAVEEYKLALQLDPSLADPTVNPHAASNPRLRTVQMMIYGESSLGMPLVKIPGGELEEPADENPER